jgi:hypothetical protein
MSWGERWFLLILVELLTITQWVEVRGDFCWYWWNCWPSFNELRWEVILLILVELLTITQWVEVEVIFVDNHLSPKLIEWWSTILPISTKITSHFNSLSDDQQFHQYVCRDWLMIYFHLLTFLLWLVKLSTTTI